MTSLRNSLDLAKSPLSGIAVPVKNMTLLFGSMVAVAAVWRQRQRQRQRSGGGVWRQCVGGGGNLAAAAVTAPWRRPCAAVAVAAAAW